MPETITANGVDLRTILRNVESLSGALRAPARRGSNIVVPGRHGALKTQRKRYDVGELILPMWVKGANPDGTVGTEDTQLTRFYEQIDLLTQLFHSDTVVIDHTLPDGSVRRAVCELLEPLEWERNPASPLFGRVSVALTIPGAFWSDTTNRTQTVSLTTGQSVTLSQFAGATAPMDELMVTFGPGNNPELGQGGIFVAYDGIIAAGRTLVVNTTTWTLTGTGGLVVDYSKLRHGGEARWFTLHPQSGGPEVALLHTGGGSMQVTIVGPRKYLTG